MNFAIAFHELKFLRLVVLAVCVMGFSAPEANASRWRRTRRRSACCRAVQCVPAVAARPPQVFVSPSGKSYAIVETNEPGTEEIARRFELEHMESERRAIAPLELERAERAVDSETFAGHDRKAAKTSIAEAETAQFDNLHDLLVTLPADAAMLHHEPPITRDENSERVAEEQRNVTVSAFLYATKRESDNDFHLILGTGGPPGSRQYMTAEVSGLPESGADRPRLHAARTQFEDFFSAKPIGTQYRRFSPAIPVTISGSLFYDVDHPPGAVGPVGLKPATAWEIHPVTAIDFE